MVLKKMQVGCCTDYSYYTEGALPDIHTSYKSKVPTCEHQEAAGGLLRGRHFLLRDPQAPHWDCSCLYQLCCWVGLERLHVGLSSLTHCSHSQEPTPLLLQFLPTLIYPDEHWDQHGTSIDISYSEGDLTMPASYFVLHCIKAEFLLLLWISCIGTWKLDRIGP